MNARITAHYAALLGTVALVAGCAPDTPERVGAGASPLSRNESGQPGALANRDTNGGSIRPPITTTTPAAPGAAVPPAATPRLLARA